MSYLGVYLFNNCLVMIKRLIKWLIGIKILIKYV